MVVVNTVQALEGCLSTSNCLARGKFYILPFYHCYYEIIIDLEKIEKQVKLSYKHVMNILAFKWWVLHGTYSSRFKESGIIIPLSPYFFCSHPGTVLILLFDKKAFNITCGLK